MYLIKPNETDRMFFATFAGIEIFRPRSQTELLIRREAEKYLREGYASGVYTGRDRVNAVLQHEFSFYHKLLAERLPELASRHFMEFLLYQYDQATKIEEKRKKGMLAETEAEKWSELGPTIRRSVKYLAERVALLQPGEAPRAAGQALLQLAEEVAIYSEQLVRIYTISDQTFMLFPDQTELTVLPEGMELYLDLLVPNFNHYNIRHRLDRHLAAQGRFIPKPPFYLDHAAHADVLDEAFGQTFGFSYTAGRSALIHLIKTTLAPADGFDIPFCNRQMVVDGISQDLGFAPDKFERFLAGFSLSVIMMGEEGREIWKPKQEYRAFRRGLFEFPHPTGPHIIWSRAMARECLLAVSNGLVFQRVSPEWKSPEIDEALAKLSNRAGKWFERVTADNMEAVGIFGKRSLKAIGYGDRRMAVPTEIGELDYLGYHPGWRTLILLECKMVDGFASEARHFRDELSAFVNSENAYVRKFRRKIDWVGKNMSSIGVSLASVLSGDMAINPTRFATAMVTFHPTIVSSFVPDLPCVSLTELMLDIETKSSWPYALGASDC